MGETVVYYVGTEDEVARHAEPLAAFVTVRIVPPSEVGRIVTANDVVVLFSEHFERFRQAIAQAHAAGATTLYAIDGILEWRNAWGDSPDQPACPWTMRPVLSHKVACIGAGQKRVLDGWGNADKTELVGLPRLDRFSVERRPTTRNVFRILVATARWPWYGPDDRRLVEESLEQLKTQLERLGRIGERPIEVVWRLSRGLDQHLGVTNGMTDVSGAELARQLAEVDALITTPSTTMLEGMLAEVPTALLDFTNSPRYVDAAWTMTSADQILDVIRQLADPPAARMAYQRAVLDDALCCDRRAAERMAALVERMAAGNRQCRDEGRPCAFPPNLLNGDDLPRTSGPRLELAAAYRDEPAFRTTDLAVLQAELAHARRHIDQLNARIEQLAAELAEAHNIFEQIHRHPIAGPIVRARQKLLDKVAALKQRRAQLDSASDVPRKPR